MLANFNIHIMYATIWCPCPGLSSADPTGEYRVKKLFSVIKKNGTTRDWWSEDD